MKYYAQKVGYISNPKYDSTQMAFTASRIYKVGTSCRDSGNSKMETATMGLYGVLD